MCQVGAASSDVANSKKPAKTDKQVQAAAAAAAVVTNFGEHTSAKQSVPQKAGKKDQGAAHGEKMPKDNQLDDDEFNFKQEPAPRAGWQAEVTGQSYCSRHTAGPKYMSCVEIENVLHQFQLDQAMS